MSEFLKTLVVMIIGMMNIFFLGAFVGKYT